MHPVKMNPGEKAAREPGGQLGATEREAEHPATLAIRAELDRTRAWQLAARKHGSETEVIAAARARVKALRDAGLLEVT